MRITRSGHDGHVLEITPSDLDRANAYLTAHGIGFKPGDAVIYLYTEGGGGGSGHKPNPKRPIHARIVSLSARTALIDFPGSPHAWRGVMRVWLKNLQPMP